MSSMEQLHSHGDAAVVDGGDRVHTLQVALLVSEKQAENRAREEKLKADEERVKAQRMRSMKSKVCVTMYDHV
jgi:hypothetical protein